MSIARHTHAQKRVRLVLSHNADTVGCAETHSSATQGCCRGVHSNVLSGRPYAGKRNGRWQIDLVWRRPPCARAITHVQLSGALRIVWVALLV